MNINHLIKLLFLIWLVFVSGCFKHSSNSDISVDRLAVLKTHSLAVIAANSNDAQSVEAFAKAYNSLDKSSRLELISMLDEKDNNIFHLLSKSRVTAQTMKTIKKMQVDLNNSSRMKELFTKKNSDNKTILEELTQPNKTKEDNKETLKQMISFAIEYDADPYTLPDDNIVPFLSKVDDVTKYYLKFISKGKSSNIAASLADNADKDEISNNYQVAINALSDANSKEKFKKNMFAHAFEKDLKNTKDNNNLRNVVNKFFKQEDIIDLKLVVELIDQFADKLAGDNIRYIASVMKSLRSKFANYDRWFNEVEPQYKRLSISYKLNKQVASALFLLDHQIREEWQKMIDDPIVMSEELQSIVDLEDDTQKELALSALTNVGLQPGEYGLLSVILRLPVTKDTKKMFDNLYLNLSIEAKKAALAKYPQLNNNDPNYLPAMFELFSIRPDGDDEVLLSEIKSEVTSLVDKDLIGSMADTVWQDVIANGIDDPSSKAMKAMQAVINLADSRQEFRNKFFTALLSKKDNDHTLLSKLSLVRSDFITQNHFKLWQKLLSQRPEQEMLGKNLLEGLFMKVPAEESVKNQLVEDMINSAIRVGVKSINYKIVGLSASLSYKQKGVIGLLAVLKRFANVDDQEVRHNLFDALIKNSINKEIFSWLAIGTSAHPQKAFAAMKDIISFSDNRAKIAQLINQVNSNDETSLSILLSSNVNNSKAIMLLIESGATVTDAKMASLAIRTAIERYIHSYDTNAHDNYFYSIIKFVVDKDITDETPYSGSNNKNYQRITALAAAVHRIIVNEKNKNDVDIKNMIIDVAGLFRSHFNVSQYDDDRWNTYINKKLPDGGRTAVEVIEQRYPGESSLLTREVS